MLAARSQVGVLGEVKVCNAALFAREDIARRRENHATIFIGFMCHLMLVSIEIKIVKNRQPCSHSVYMSGSPSPPLDKPPQQIALLDRQAVVEEEKCPFPLDRDQRNWPLLDRSGATHGLHSTHEAKPGYSGDISSPTSSRFGPAHEAMYRQIRTATQYHPSPVSIAAPSLQDDHLARPAPAPHAGKQATEQSPITCRTHTRPISCEWGPHSASAMYIQNHGGPCRHLCKRRCTTSRPQCRNWNMRTGPDDAESADYRRDCCI